MPDSIQLDIMKRLTAHIQGVIPANGYDFNLSEGVFRGRLTYGENDPLPMVSIVEHLNTDVPVDVAGENDIMQKFLWVLLVQGWLKHEPENPTDSAYQLKAAVEHRLARLIKMNPSNGDPLFPAEYLLGIQDTITGIAIGPGVVSVAVRPESSARAFFYLPVGISLAFDISEPFAV